jgi:hypothetical protein
MLTVSSTPYPACKVIDFFFYWKYINPVFPGRMYKLVTLLTKTNPNFCQKRHRIYLAYYQAVER